MVVGGTRKSKEYNENILNLIFVFLAFERPVPKLLIDLQSKQIPSVSKQINADKNDLLDT